MLQLEEDMLLLGSNDWYFSSSRYKEYVNKNGRSPRDNDGFKIKFDELSSTKMPNDSSCSPAVFRAKTWLATFDLVNAGNLGTSHHDVVELHALIVS